MIFYFYFLVVKKPLESVKNTTSSSNNIATSPTKSPSLLNNFTSTPLEHPSFKDIAATAKTLHNPPDLFLQPPQKRRSIRHQTIAKEAEKVDIKTAAKKETLNSPQNDSIITSKLVSVFPSTSDELDVEEIEHAASAVVDEDSLDSLSGPSKIIPNLELHENIDFSALISDVSIVEEKAPSIEPIIVEFTQQELCE